MLNPWSPLPRPVTAGEKAQALLHYELCRRRALLGTPSDCSQAWVSAKAPLGQGSRLQDEHLETSHSLPGGRWCGRWQRAKRCCLTLSVTACEKRPVPLLTPRRCGPPKGPLRKELLIACRAS